MQKLISIIFVLLMSATSVYAESITKTLNSLGVNKSAVSVSIRDVKDGDVIYSLNDRTPRMPASTLKLVTSMASKDILGVDYKYKTSLYKSTNNDLYMKLSADPLLGVSDLEKMIETAKAKNIVPKTFYLDDTVFDSVEWGDGWQWDDELNPLMPKFSPYNINGNLVKVDVVPTIQNSPAKIQLKPFYPMTIINNVISDAKGSNSVSIKRNEDIAPNMFSVDGAVSKSTTVVIPVLNPKINFKLRLEDSITKKKFEYFAPFKNAKLPDKNVYLVDETEHELAEMLPMILKNSNNMVAETVFKTAGSVYSNDRGTIENSLNMLNAYFEKIGLNIEDIKVVDGSGVSKNNIMTSKFMTDFLIYKASDEDFEDFKNMLPAPGEGTLKNRMLYFKDNLRAKTGTLSDASAIAGYITTRRGKVFAFDIMINDAKTSNSDKKNIEEQILRNIYLNY